MEVIAVQSPLDLALEFYSVLTRKPHEPLKLLLLNSLTAETLPPADLDERCGHVLALFEKHRSACATVQSDQVRDFVDCELGPTDSIWTHGPADRRGGHATIGWLVSSVGPTDAARRYSVANCGGLEFAGGTSTVLPTSAIEWKIDALRRWGAATTVGEVRPCERFVELSQEEALSLYAVTNSLSTTASLAVDPWGFEWSRYEIDRLDRTAEWVRHAVEGHPGRLIEVGSCEGALTRRLHGDDHVVVACEPDDRFRGRLRRSLPNGVTVRPDSLHDLVDQRLSGAAYLLIEMLYYVDDPGVLDRVPADLMLISLPSEGYTYNLKRWMESTTVWKLINETELASPRIDWVCRSRALAWKDGSMGTVWARIADR